MACMRNDIAAAVAIYARYSTDRQDARSIDDQMRRCRVLAKARSYQIVEEFGDAAVSGTHTDRTSLQRLIGEARRGAFRAVLVDDLSRLSRDLGDFWRLTFSEFASMGVRVIDVTTGMASDDQGARMAFGAMALISDGFIQMIRTETHRGLEGRALAGFATGGKTYGFGSEVEPNPPQPDHPRKVRIIVAAEAAVVVRIFELHAGGMAVKKIAAQLNQDGVPAPHDNGRGNKKGRGWGHTTILSMLRNEQYIGKWVWNKENWVQVAGTNRYRRVPRPVAQHVVREVPELRIVPPALWDRVHERLRTRAHEGRRRTGNGKHGTSLLSGLLRCGSCGGAFVVVSRRYKGTDPAGHANFGCSVSRSRGGAICANTRTISQKKVTAAVIHALREQLTLPDLAGRFVDSFTRHFHDLNQVDGAEVRQLEQQVQRATNRVKNVTGALAVAGFSEALLAQLKEEETSLNALRTQLAAASRDKRPKILPHPHVIQSYVDRLLGLLETDVEQAHALLVRHMPPLVLTPEAGAYRLTGGFNLSLLLPSDASTNPTAGDASHAPREESMIGPVGGTGIEPATRAV
jgi:site-specific DNA recombinase